MVLVDLDLTLPSMSFLPKLLFLMIPYLNDLLGSHKGLLNTAIILDIAYLYARKMSKNYKKELKRKLMKMLILIILSSIKFNK